ncbi:MULTISPECIES: hypothetical protein [unclassified Mesorhizobium]
MAYCDRCMSFLASKNGKQMKLPALGVKWILDEALIAAAGAPH